MITPNHPIYYVARITLECQSPLSIKADESDPTLDSTLFRDAHGNPTIAGTSIAGVLRHLADAQGLPKSLFGQSEGGSGQTQDGHQFSPVQVSFGFVHDASNQPYMGSLQARLNDKADDLIEFLSDVKPILRDQIALTEYSAAQDQGKFDVSALPKGTRFTFELGLAATLEEERTAQVHWQQLLALVHCPLFRLGGLTHRGFGQLNVVAITQQAFHFTQPDAIDQWQRWQRQSWKPQERSQGAYDSASVDQFERTKTMTLSLNAEDFWRIGEGASPLQRYNKEPDAKPYTESVIVWKNHRATLQFQQLTVPATGIKGALRHRTLYHLRRLAQDWSGSLQDKTLAPLFGIEAVHTKNQGNVGAIIINDLYPEIMPEALPSRVKVMMHNAIDRFTGGTLKGALFSEELIYKGTLNCTIIFDLKRLEGVSDHLMQAFICAIQDLGEGRLALGAGSSKGHGYFTISHLADIVQQLHNLKNKESA